MPPIDRIRASRVARGAIGLTVALALATVLVALLGDVAGVPNASAGYLLAVVGLAVALGTTEAVIGAIAGFLLANYLFTEPVHTLTVVDSGEWLNLLLLLVVGIVVGQLAGRQRERAETAEVREREARGLFQVSRALSTAADTGEAMQDVVRILKAETSTSRVWIGLHGQTPLERVLADTGVGSETPTTARHEVLKRAPGDEPARWVGLHAAGRPVRSVPASDLAAYRVVIEAADRPLGSIWALRPRRFGAPGREETRLLAAAADQVAQALERDRLRAEATSAEVARQSDALKSALLDSVSHDLRTPLATIRAAAGSLMDGSDHAALMPVAEAIDKQAVHLDRLVTNLLDMSRIEAGELKPNLRPVLLDDAIADTVGRLRTSLTGRDVQVSIPEDLPPALVDEVFLDAVVPNILDNALKYTDGTAPIRVSACEPTTPGDVLLVIEDGGPGVPPEAQDRIFEKFYRVATSGTATRTASRRGSGIGLAITRGLVEAMGGSVEAGRSDLGGLAVTIRLRATTPASTA